MTAIKIILTLFLILLLNIRCSPHCDDEDYTRDEKEAAIYKSDSLTVSATMD